MQNTDLVFLHGSYTPGATHYVDKYLDGYYTIQFMTSGGVELFYNEQHYDLEGPWFWPAYPGPHIRFHVHSAKGYRDWEHRYLAFRGPLVHHWFSEGLFPLHPQPCPSGKDYAPVFDALLAQSRQHDYWGVRRAINMLEGLLLDLAEQRSQTKIQELWLQKVLEELSSTTVFVPDYAELARLCNMSLSTLRRQFRDATGCTLHQYVLQCRISQARRLLYETDLSVKAIALQLGYSDIYFFSRQFHAQTGVSPLSFRRSRQI